MAIIAPEIKKQFFDSNGDPLSGGKLHIYEAGTTTPAESYTSEEGDVANANPIILNSRGEVGGLFLSNGNYKFVLTDSDDVTIWTQDNITIRDVGAELDSLQTSVNTINNTIASAEITTRLVSGKISANSGAPRFLRPLGTTNQVEILGNATTLSYIIQDTTYNMVIDKVYSGFVTAPTTNNTALVNNSSYADQDYTKTLGEFGSVIPYDNAGSEITSRDGEMHAFKIVGTSTEYFLGRIDNTNSVLRDCKRGYFLDSSSNPVTRTAFSDNDTITLMKLSWLYLGTDQAVLVSYTEPTYSTTEPSSPADGDMWYDLANSVWKRFESTAFIEKEYVPIGYCIQDENGNTVGARAFPFFKEWNEENTIQLSYQDTTSVRSIERDNRISVNGSLIQYREMTLSWNIVNDLESGETEAASTRYYFYVKENGDLVVSPHGPTDERGLLRGFYHPHEMWRYIGMVYNNSSSNFEDYAVSNSLEHFSPSLGCVGEIRHSMLSELTFQAQMGTGWRLMNGQSVVGSLYEQITNYSTVPDARGRFLRMKNNGASVNPDGDVALGTNQADLFGSHNHGGGNHSHGAYSYTGSSTSGNTGLASSITGFTGKNATSRGYRTTNGDGTQLIQSSGTFLSTDGGAETRPKNTTVNYFIKVN